MPCASCAALVSVGLTLVPMSRPGFAETPARAVEAAVKKPMMFVARLVTQEKLRPNVDEKLQGVPSAKALGAKWNASNPRGRRPGR